MNKETKTGLLICIIIVLIFLSILISIWYYSNTYDKYCLDKFAIKACNSYNETFNETIIYSYMYIDPIIHCNNEFFDQRIYSTYHFNSYMFLEEELNSCKIRLKDKCNFIQMLYKDCVK